jgi:hypothetical protein
MQTPTTSYLRGYSIASMEAVPVSNPPFFTTHPGMGGEKPITVRTMPDTVLPSMPLEAQNDDRHIPGFLRPDLIHSPSTPSDTPRPGLN